MLDFWKTPNEVYQATEKQIRAALNNMKGVTENTVQRILQSKDLTRAQELEHFYKVNEIRCITMHDLDYPDKLRQINNPPYMLYVRGKEMSLKEQFDKRRNIAIIGARNCTAYGRKMAMELSFALASHGINIISGMARGIDGYAHGGALKARGMTTAVLGSGICRCYPREHIGIYQELVKSGMIISEYPMDDAPESWHFPQRNRIISGLCDGIIVVEAKIKSGSLITAEYGLEQGKDIYAVPGRVGDSLSEGCNNLIKEGAGIVTSVHQILNEMEIEIKPIVSFEKNQNITLEKDLELLYSCVDYFPKNIEELMRESNMSSVQFFKNIITLQMMNLVDEPSKNMYVRK